MKDKRNIVIAGLLGLVLVVFSTAAVVESRRGASFPAGLMAQGVQIPGHNAAANNILTCTNANGMSEWSSNVTANYLTTLGGVISWRADESFWDLVAVPNNDYLYLSNGAEVVMSWVTDGLNIMALTNGWSMKAHAYQTVAGTLTRFDGALTNIAISYWNQASVMYVNAATNVNLLMIDFRFIPSSAVSRGTLILTNRTATPRNFSLGAISNNWISLQQFDGIAAPFVVTNSQAARFDWEMFGSNVYYSYKPHALPAN